MIPTILNEIYDIVQIPPDISKSIFKKLLKKPGTTEREFHRKSVL